MVSKSKPKSSHRSTSKRTTGKSTRKTSTFLGIRASLAGHKKLKNGKSKPQYLYYIDGHSVKGISLRSAVYHHYKQHHGKGKVMLRVSGKPSGKSVQISVQRKPKTNLLIIKRAVAKK